MSDPTPRTDAAEYDSGYAGRMVVPAAFAREIERELSRLRSAASAVIDMLPHGPDRYELETALWCGENK